MSVFSEIRATWGLLGLLALVDLIGLIIAGVSVASQSAFLVVGALALLLIIAKFYNDLRPEPRLAAFAFTGAQLLVYTALAGILSYLLTMTNRPLIDSWLVEADRMLGFDWKAIYQGAENKDTLRVVLRFLYFSLIPQLLLIELFLFTKGRLERARELFWLFVLTSLGCVLIGGLFPAAGAVVTVVVNTGEAYVRDFFALRERTLPVFDLATMQGVIQFPSFHLAMAVILTYAVRDYRFLFPFFLIVNAGVVAATPFVGGHHLTDLLGGALVTFVARLILEKRYSAKDVC